MVSALVQAGDITDERWRQAFASVPRHTQETAAVLTA